MSDSYCKSCRDQGDFLTEEGLTPCPSKCKAYHRKYLPEGQSWFHSHLEAITNIIGGAGIALVAQIFVFPIYGFEPPLETNLQIMGIFTVISYVRSVFFRRVWNWIHVRGWL